MTSSPARWAARRLAGAYTGRWAPYSRLFLVGEGKRWSIDHDLLELAGLAARLRVRVAPQALLSASSDQAAFYGSHFTLLREPWSPSRLRLATAYFHGRPGTPGYPEFDECFDVLRRRHAELARVQVTHAEMHELVLSSGIDPAKVFRIPIGIDTRWFGDRSPDARQALGFPEGAFVVGSFQKDGVGWEEAAEPKWIKGPDVLVDVLARLHERVPELHVLLSGPARGYVKARLADLGIPFVHRFVERYADVGRLYAALDAYVVTSRQEGGPKGVLEAMAAGVPLVSTRVGQATEVVVDGENGWLADVEDVDALVGRLETVATGGADVARAVEAGRATAAANSYDAQLPLWRAFFDGFVVSA